MNNPSLVILAAGMGSRYGGLKQIDTVGNNGESIIDFSIYDAIEAGFKKVYLIIRQEHEKAFREALVDQVRKFVEVEFIYQDMHDLPKGFSAPTDRIKPWGTTHALWACRKQVKEAFMICNADDYYGKEAFKVMFEFLTHHTNDKHFSMVGYKLLNTLSDSGTVTRGVCEVSNHKLTGIVEIKKIKKEDSKAVYTLDETKWLSLDDQALVSMNFWGFTPAIFAIAEKQFINFLNRELSLKPLVCEHVIPTMISETLNDHLFDIQVLSSHSVWFGVTYQEDKPYVISQFEKYKSDKLYPYDLWK